MAGGAEGDEGGGGRRRGEANAPGPTPYELVFGDGAVETEHFPGFQEEAEERGVDAADPERFVMLASVGALLRDLLADPESPEAAAAGGASAIHQAGLLLFHGFHFWRFGKRVYFLEPELARKLVDATPAVGEWELTPPHPAGYLQLPRNLFWSRIDEGTPPEPVDGFFWSLIGEEDASAPPYRRLDLLLVLGARAGRPGFSVIPVAMPLQGQPGHWAAAKARPEGRDFGNILPGGELEDLRALVTEPEVLKLVSLIFWYAAAHPGAEGPVEEREGGQHVQRLRESPADG
jgi:hypothetical protein